MRAFADTVLHHLLAGVFFIGSIKKFLPLIQSKAEELSSLFDREIAENGGIVERGLASPSLITLIRDAEMRQQLSTCTPAQRST